MRLFAPAALAASCFAPFATAQAQWTEGDSARIEACLATSATMCGGSVFNPCMHEIDPDETGANRFQRVCYEREAAAWRAVIGRHAAEYRQVATPQVAEQLDAYLQSANANDEARCAIEDAELEELSGLAYGECLAEVLPARDAWLRGLIAHHQDAYQQER